MLLAARPGSGDHDHDKALDFYTNVLGLEKRVESPTPDGPRFLTVGVTGTISSKKVDETLLPLMSKLPGFSGYHLIKAGDGVMTSIGFFDTSAQADESTKVASAWVRDQKLEKALPNPPRITRGEIVAHKTPPRVARTWVGR